MTRSSKLLLILVGTGFGCGCGGVPAARAEVLPAPVARETLYSPKLTFRVGNGFLMNAGTAQVQTLTAVGAVNLLYSLFLSDKLAIGFGYSSNTPLFGFTASTRYYFKGQGTRSTQTGPLSIDERHDAYALYGGLELTQNSYEIQLNRESLAAGDMIRGVTTMSSVLLGADMRLNRRFEVNVELDLAAIPLGASNSYVILKAYQLNAGLSYLW